MAAPIVVSTYSELKSAFATVLSWQEDARIEISDSFAFESTTLEPTLPTINHGQAITIASHISTQKLSSFDNSSLTPKENHYRHFFIQNGTLILENITLCGYDLAKNESEINIEDSEYGGVEVRNGGTLRIKQESIIEYVRGSDAGGIWAKEGSEILMTSGEVRNCICDPVTLGFELTGGVAFGNLIRSEGRLVIRDGKIHFTTNKHFNGIMVGESGLFEMEGGIIENTVSAIFMQRGSVLIYSDGIIRNNDTGIDTDYTRGKKEITINSGLITNNRVGIHVSEGTVITINNISISNAEGRDGIGILASYGSTGQLTINGGRIFNNAQGICWQQTGIKCIINDAEIFSNGYGIAIDNAEVTIKGGKIYNSEIRYEKNEEISPNLLEGGYPISGMGIMVGFEGKLYFENGEIFGCERIGIACIQNGYSKIDNCKIYNNLIGVRFVCSVGEMFGGEIYSNYLAGIELANFQDSLESDGSTFTLHDGKIYNNLPPTIGNPAQTTWGQGISVRDYSTLIINGGEIFGHTSYPQGFGAWVRNNSKAIMNGGRIYENYKAIEFGLGLGPTGPIAEIDSGSTFVMNNGLVNNNTIGVTVWSNCHFTMNGGEIFDNFGYSNWVATTGGLGVGVCFGTFLMENGKIYGHRGFPQSWARATFNQPVGAAIAVLFGGYIDLRAGEIFNNIGSTGAGVYLPNEWYGPSGYGRVPEITHYQSIKIGKDVSFYDNFATDDYPYIFDGSFNTSGIDVTYINSNIFFKSTSVGSHVLNNYDVNFTNYSGGLVLNRPLRAFFTDECLAEIVASKLEVSLDDFVATTEFETITTLDAKDCCIKSLGGIHNLSQLRTIDLSGNQIMDISPILELQFLEKAEILGQNIILPQIYVTHEQQIKIVNIEFEKISLDLFKYNGQYDQDRGGVTWFERGRMRLSWFWQQDIKPSISFSGQAHQTAIPIPINQLFTNKNIINKVAKMLNKMYSSPIDVTELLRFKVLDLSDIEESLLIEDLTGLEYFLNIKFVNLTSTGITSTDLPQLLVLFPNAKFKIDT